MSSSIRLILDFDGTLVVENSSRLLTAELLARRNTLSHRILRETQGGRFQRVMGLGFAVINRIIGDQDSLLLLVLRLNRSYLRQHGAEVYAAVASKLTLNTGLELEYSQPFELLSTGLRPILSAFLALHPQLVCTRITASSASQPRLRLMTLADKVKLLSDLPHARYFTDYLHEADLISAALQTRVSVTRPNYISPNELYFAEISS